MTTTVVRVKVIRTRTIVEEATIDVALDGEEYDPDAVRDAACDFAQEISNDSIELVFPWQITGEDIPSEYIDTTNVRSGEKI